MAFTMTVAELIDVDTSGLLGKHPSWERVALGDVAFILNGAPFNSALFSTTEGMPLVRIRDILAGKTKTYYNGTYEDSYVVTSGDLLVGMDGDFYSGFWGSKNALLNQRVCKISPHETFYNKRLLALVLPAYLAAINANTPSVTVKHLSSKTIAEIDLPLPPRAEQTRIVEKLEALLVDLDAGTAELRTAQRKLGQFRQSLLKVAVEGGLTANWRKQNPPSENGEQLLKRVLAKRRDHWEAKQLAKFEEQGKLPPKNWRAKYSQPLLPDITNLPRLPAGWVWASLDMLGEIVSGVAKGTKRNADVQLFEVPYLRVANVQRGFLDLSDVKTILATEREIAELTLRAGDVLFNEGGDRDKLGRGCVWRDEVVSCIHQNHVFRMRPYLPELIPELISHHGNSFGKQWFQNAGKQTTNLASINITMLRHFPVPLGPALEQIEILSQLDAYIENFRRQEETVELGLKQSVAQRKNILNFAFSGQLVPQVSTDESASVLLTRIRNERPSYTMQPKIRRENKSKRMKASDVDPLIEWIKTRCENTFSFDDIRAAIPVDYETVKNSIFRLLADSNPIIEQFFDEKTKRVQFRRTL